MMKKDIDELLKLKKLVKSLFDDYLDYAETHGEDQHIVHPIRVSCSRALMAEPLSKLLQDIKEIVK